jgi:phosphate transport system permease protein
MNRGRVFQRRIANGAFSIGCYVVTAVALAFLAAIMWSLVSKGVHGLSPHILTADTPAPGSQGGLRNAILGSLMMCALAMVLALLVGVLAGTWLAEYAGDSHLGSVVRFFNDVLLSAPSILVGLFVYGILVAPFHSYSGYAGAVALAMLAAPVVTRTTEDVMRLQPAPLRESSVALGAPLWKTILAVLWRSSKGGIVTGALLAFARITGETAPLLFTALNNQFFNLNMSKPTASLPVVIFQFALSAYDDWRRLAWAGALIIAVAVLAITIIARLFTREPRRS